MEDLRGKNVSIGAAGSGVYFNAMDFLAAYDMTEADINPQYLSFGDSAEALKRRQDRRGVRRRRRAHRCSGRPVHHQGRVSGRSGRRARGEAEGDQRRVHRVRHSGGHL